MNHVTDERTDRPLGRPLHDWLEGSIEELPDGAELPSAIRSDVLSRLPGTPQRRRWWPFRWHPFGLGATRSAGREESRAEGRYRTMFNATRVAAIVAILALSGSLALIAGPLAPDRDADAVPAAEMTFDPADFGLFTGTWVGAACAACQDGRWRGPIEVDDPRIGGTMHMLAENNDYGPLVMEPWGAISLAILIENEGGAWHGQGMAYLRPGPGGHQFQVLLSGDEDYEGLTALLTASQDQPGFLHPIEGVIFPGDPPEFPTLPPLE